MDRNLRAWRKLYPELSLRFSMILALFLLVTGLVTSILAPTVLDPRIPGLLLFALGMLIAISVFDRRSEREEHKEKIQESEKIHGSLKKLEPVISVSLGAVDAGVEKVFARRKDNKKAQEAIEAHLLDEDTENISIAAVALPKFLHAGGPYVDEIYERLDDVHWRILLLDPRSDEAKKRSDREKNIATIGDIKLSIKQLQEYMDKGKDVETRLYNDCSPILFMLIIDSCMLVEPYHYGRVIRPDGDEPVAERVVPGCIGGRVPFLQIRNLGQYDKPYAILCDHFEYLWQKRSIPVYSGIQIASCDQVNKTITLKNTHRYTAVSLENWQLEVGYKTPTGNRGNGAVAIQTIYCFTDEDWLEEQTILRIIDAEGKNKKGVRYLNPSSQLSTFMEAFWGHKDEDREIRLINVRRRVAFKYPYEPDKCYVGQSELLPEGAIPGSDVY